MSRNEADESVSVSFILRGICGGGGYINGIQLTQFGLLTDIAPSINMNFRLNALLLLFLLVVDNICIHSTSHEYRKTSTRSRAQVFFDYKILITPLVSANSSCNHGDIDDLL